MCYFWILFFFGWGDANDDDMRVIIDVKGAYVTVFI